MYPFVVGLLDAGEAGAIAPARCHKDNWFITDDAAAPILAASLGLEVHGSLMSGMASNPKPSQPG
jgi:predicted nucleic acid-binding protein